MKATPSTLSEYDQQAAEFLSRFGLSITLKEGTKAAIWTTAGQHYVVNLSKTSQAAIDAADEIVTLEGMLAIYQSRAGSAPGAIAEVKSQWKEQAEILKANPPIRMSFDFWGSQYDKEKGVQPSAYDILSCVASDSSCPDTFKDFCAEFGYDEDSRKAEATFKRCLAFSKKINAFFTEEELEALREIQ